MKSLVITMLVLGILVVILTDMSLTEETAASKPAVVTPPPAIHQTPVEPQYIEKHYHWVI